MGRHIDATVIGSRRAAVLTLTSSALLVIGGLVILHESGGLRLSPARPAMSSTSSTSPGPAPRTVLHPPLASVPVTNRSGAGSP